MNNKELFLFCIFFVVFALAVIALIIFIHSRNEKYRLFVEENSKAIANLKELNSHYHFLKIKNFDMKHSYDNENFYGNISCQDYLTYELVYCKKEVSNAMKDTLLNKMAFNEYMGKVSEIKQYGVYSKDIGKLKQNKLIKTEIKVFVSKVLNPQINFEIPVALTLTNINGNYKISKRRSFKPDEIKTIISKLNQKQGDFYTNRDVWDAICRVERGKVTNRMRFAIYARDNNRCRICGRRTNNLEIDHIKPIAKGGKSTMDNLQTLCHRCNVRKGDSY